MKKLTIAFLSLFSFATVTVADEITVTPRFSKAGQIYYLTVTSEKKSTHDGKVISEGNATTPVTLKIIPVANGKVQADWKYGTTTVTTQGQVVQAPGANLTFEMIFNDKGEYQGLKDFQKVKTEYIRSMEQMTKNNPKYNDGSMKDVLQRMTKDEETFTSLVMREPTAYFFPWGMTFDTNKPIAYQTQFDYLGMMTLPVSGRVTVKPVDKLGKLFINGNQKSDMKTTDRDGTASTIAMRETSSYSVDIATGFVEKFSMNRIVKANSTKGNRIDEQRIEISLSK